MGNDTHMKGVAFLWPDCFNSDTLQHKKKMFGLPFSLLFACCLTGRLLDILRGQGQRGLQAFMESLEFYHPEQYTQLTGQQPTQRCSLILGKRGYVCMVTKAHCSVESYLLRALNPFWGIKKTRCKFIVWIRPIKSLCSDFGPTLKSAMFFWTCSWANNKH